MLWWWTLKESNLHHPTNDLLAQQFLTRSPSANKHAREIPLSKVNKHFLMHVFVPICAHSHTVVHRKMHSCKAHTWRQVFLSGVSSCQALLIHARLKDSLRHCAHASTHSTFTAHRCTPGSSVPPLRLQKGKNAALISSPQRQQREVLPSHRLCLELCRDTSKWE